MHPSRFTSDPLLWRSTWFEDPVRYRRVPRLLAHALPEIPEGQAGEGQAYCDARRHKAEALAEDQVSHVGCLRAESHSNCDLASALRDAVGHDTVNSEDGEQQRDRGEGI